MSPEPPTVTPGAPATLAAGGAPAVPDPFVNVRLDYQVTVDAIKLFSDIRFRCLVFVTSLTAVAGTLLARTGDPGARLALGLVGLVSTLGIVVYELRNSQLYEAAMHRAKWLERELGMASTTTGGGRNGLFNERPPYVDGTGREALALPEVCDGAAGATPSIRWMRFGPVKVKHDQGLALIYGASLGAWVYLAVDGLLSLPAPVELPVILPDPVIHLLAAVVGLLALLAAIGHFVDHDDRRYKLH